MCTILEGGATCRIHSDTTMSNSKLPAALRNAVWNEYIGSGEGKGICFCCGLEPILRSNYECGHVVSKAKGGNDRLDNLRPVCGMCNKSMGVKNMIEFANECGFSACKVKAADEEKLLSTAYVSNEQVEGVPDTEEKKKCKPKCAGCDREFTQMTLNKYGGRLCGACHKTGKSEKASREILPGFTIADLARDIERPSDGSPPAGTEGKSEWKFQFDLKVLKDKEVDDLFQLTVPDLTRQAKEAAVAANAQALGLPVGKCILFSGNFSKDELVALCKSRAIATAKLTKPALVQALEEHIDRLSRGCKA